MCKAILISFLLLALGCGGSDSSGTNGIPASVDQMCRDYAANANEGEDCGPGSNGLVDCGGDTQQCYERCLSDYTFHAEGQNYQSVCPTGWKCFDYPAECPDEWKAELECILNLECNDLFGDCDSLAEATTQCVNEVRMTIGESRQQWCTDNCPNDADCARQGYMCRAEAPPDCVSVGGNPEICGSPCESAVCINNSSQYYCFNGICAIDCTDSSHCGENERCQQGRCYAVMSN